MNKTIDEILKQDKFSKDDLIKLLQADKEERNVIFTQAAKVKADYIGRKP